MRTLNLPAFLPLVFLSLLIFVLDFYHLLQVPKNIGYFITNPIVFGLYKTKQQINKQLFFITSARFAAQENKALEEQIASILSENAKLRTKLGETEALLEQERHLDPKTYDLLEARPIGLSRFLLIDKGLSDGLKNSQAVLFKDNYIGQIVDLSEKGSRVKLLTDPDSKVAAFSFGQEGKAKGLLVGKFNTEMILDKILHEEKISVGDLVYSEGTEGFLPRGLVLGRVVEVLEQENEVFKQAKVAPVFDVRDLELVFIIK